ncbi:MAG: sulfotransferase [Methylococcaceae bacterium]
MIDNLFLSVGAMKAGTTWLYAQLKEHPDIYFTPEKEIHYFANKVGIDNQLNHRARTEKLKQCLDKYHKGNLKQLAVHAPEIAWYSEYATAKQLSNQWYENLFRMKATQKYCADFSNLYCLMNKDGWDNVHKVTKNIKVIYTLRDPLARLWSHYKFHMLWVNREDEALEAGFEHFKDLLDKPWFWNNADYAKNYSALTANLAKEDLVLLYFEDFRADPLQKLTDIQQFLNIKTINASDESLQKQVNKTKEFNIPDEWYDYMQKKLQPLCLQMQDLGIWHPNWRKLM